MKNSPCVDQPDRARSFDPDVPFALEQMKRDTTSWSHAIFVVHDSVRIDNAEKQDNKVPTGIKDVIVEVIAALDTPEGNTARPLLNGFEDAADQLQKSSGKSWQEMSTSYVMEGYWGDWGNFADNFPELWNRMNESSRKHFQQLWTKRPESNVRTAIWFASKLALAPWRDLTDWKDSREGIINKLREFLYRAFVRVPLHLGVIFVSWPSLLALLLWPRGRRILSTVLGDIRLYVAPRGAVEQSIRQNIDRRVRDLFLQMIGLELDNDTKEFTNLSCSYEHDKDSEKRKLSQVRNKGPHGFDHITWVCHGFGTVVSYNVIGDLLHKCKALREEKGDKTPNEVTRVEKGLYRFYTLGSPLGEINRIFPNVIRPWPEEYLRKNILEDEYFAGQNPWWINFRHIWDPISGPVSRSRLCSAAREFHSPQILTLPGIAHFAYWHTNSIMKYILAQGNPRIPGRESAALPRWPQHFAPKILWHVSLFFALALVCALEFHGALLAIGYLLTKIVPWWNWLISVPILGPILHFFYSLIVKLFGWIAFNLPRNT